MTGALVDEVFRPVATYGYEALGEV
jgi:hypothetical protein